MGRLVVGLYNYSVNMSLAECQKNTGGIVNVAINFGMIIKQFLYAPLYIYINIHNLQNLLTDVLVRECLYIFFLISLLTMTGDFR